MSYALGQAPMPAWYSVWSHAGGSLPDQWFAWAWTTLPHARLMSGSSKGRVPGSGFEQHRLRRLGPGKGYQWYELQGAMGVWWVPTHIGWVYTNEAGFMQINGSLTGISGDTTLLRDTGGRVIS